MHLVNINNNSTVERLMYCCLMLSIYVCGAVHSYSIFLKVKAYLNFNRYLLVTVFLLHIKHHILTNPLQLKESQL